MYQTIKSKTNERNIGLEILRMLLCFWVLLFHSLNFSKSFILNYIIQKKFHVPCFFFISFYYFFPIIKERQCFKMKLRLERLFIPYLIWPLFIWCCNNLLYLIIEHNMFGRLLYFKDLKIQLITGRCFLIQLWYMFNLLFLSIFFFLLSFLHHHSIFILLNLNSILCYILQNSLYYYNFLHSYKDNISNSIGHFIFSFPIAVTALSFNKINFIMFFTNHRTKSLIFIFLFLPIIFIYGSPNTYIGIDKNIFALFAFLGFMLLPLNKYLNR